MDRDRTGVSLWWSHPRGGEPFTAVGLQALLFRGSDLGAGTGLSVVVVGVEAEEDRPLKVEVYEGPDWPDWRAVLGLASKEELVVVVVVVVVVRSRAAGLQGLSLPESLSTSGRLPVLPPHSSSLGLLSLIFLQLGRTRYFRGSGPFWKINPVIQAS